MKLSTATFYRALLMLVILFTGMCANAQNADIDLLRDINLKRNRSLDKTMVFITNSTYPIMIAQPIAELAIGYSRHDKVMVRNGWATVAGLAITGVVTYGIKYGVDRKPPYVTYPDLQPYGHTISPSFPSGHATFSFYSAGMLSMSYPKWYVIAPSYLWASAVCYSRMHLGDHYPSDVLAGAVLGTATAWLTYRGNKWLVHRKEKKRQALLPKAPHMQKDSPRNSG